jgi:hypothetical protein
MDPFGNCATQKTNCLANCKSKFRGKHRQVCEGRCGREFYKCYFREKLDKGVNKVDECLRRVTGTDVLLNKMNGILDQGVSIILKDNSSEYWWSNNTIFVDQGDSYTTYLHELTHAYDDFYLGGPGTFNTFKGELLAYSMQYWMERLGSLSKMIPAINDGTFVCDRDRPTLESRLEHLMGGGDVFYNISKWPKMHKMTGSEMKDSLRNLGIKKNCKGIIEQCLNVRCCDIECVD